MKNILIILLIFFINNNSVESAEFTNNNLYAKESTWFGYNNQTFKLCRISSNNAIPLVKKHEIKVYFNEDKDNIKKSERRRLRNFFKKLPKNCFKIHMTSHADECGDSDYNQDLARRRGLNVWRYIENVLPYGISIKNKNITWDVSGEKHSKTHSSHDKHVKIVVESYNPQTKFDRLVIFDISGSLHSTNIGKTDSGVPLWSLKNIKLPKGTIAFVARDKRYQCKGQTLANYEPVGDDFYNEAMLVLTKLTRGKVKGQVWTDYTDPNNSRTIKQLNKIDPKHKKIWHIY